MYVLAIDVCHWKIYKPMYVVHIKQLYIKLETR